MAEYKRRARWRLLGALILVGAVAAAAPILLKDQARPLSQDLLVEMPSRASTPSPAPESEAVAPTKQKLVQPEPMKPEPLKSEPLKPEPQKSEPLKPEPLKPESLKPEPLKPTTPKAKPSPKVDGFMVQVGAYANRDAANRVKTKLEASGHRVLIQTIKTAEGAERHRVRIGPFETREQALEVRDRAKAQGYDAAVVAAS
jgi:DedD protein